MNYTVAIPAFNAEKTIRPVLEAVLKFDPAPKEVLVIDDCSTDDTHAIICEFPVRMIAHDVRRGLAGARNTALSEAKTDFIMWFDSDFVPDVSVPRKLLAEMTGDEIAAAGGRAIERGSDSRADRWRRIHAPQDHGKKRLEYAWMVMGLCAVYKVEVLRGVGGFDERFTSCGEDVEMSVRLRKFGYRLVYQPDAYGDHLRNDTDESLIQRMAGYISCTSHALMLHGKRPRRYFAPILVKQAILHPLFDLLRGRFDLLPLDFAINRARWNALMDLRPEDVM